MDLSLLPKPFAERLQEAQAALLARPRISIRLRLVLSLVLCCGLCAGYAGANVLLHRRVTAQLGSLESLETLYYKALDPRLQQSGVLVDRVSTAKALDKVVKAEHLLRQHSDARLRAQGFHDWGPLREGLAEYIGLLRRTNGQFTRDPKARFMEVEPDLREAAGRLEAVAGALIVQERGVVEHTLEVSAALPWLLLVVLLALFSVIVYAFNRTLVYSIARFQRYTRRIGQGDYTLIKPARRYRDEFTELALTVN